MNLAGDAAVIIWNDVLEEGRADFLRWHNREHIPERVAIPGFRRGRRGHAVTGGPEFLTLYEAAHVDVLSGGAYLERLDAPTDWTQRVLPQFRSTGRSICRVATSLGGGVGGFMATVRFPGTADDGAKTAGFLAEAERVLDASAEVTGAHLLLRDLAASGREIEESRLRTESVDMPGAVILVEANTAGQAEVGARALAEACRETLGRGSGGVIGVYRLAFCLTSEDLVRQSRAPSRDGPGERT